MARSSKIIACGHAVPPRCIENAEIERRLDLEPGWIERRTGIRYRFHADAGMTLADLAAQAGETALAATPLKRKDIGLVVLATSTPDQLLPPSAPLVAHRLGLSHVSAFDLAGACAGYVHAFSMADAFVRAHEKPALVIAANLLSRRIDWEEKESAVLFADAAGATILAPSENPQQGLMSLSSRTDGNHYGLLGVKTGGSSKPFAAGTATRETLIHVENGKELYRAAIELMTVTAGQALAQASLSAEKIDHFIPHQANRRISLAVCGNLGIGQEKLVSTIEDYGNSSAATIPLSLSLAYNKKPFTEGKAILFSAAGAGMTAASLVFIV